MPVALTGGSTSLRTCLTRSAVSSEAGEVEGTADSRTTSPFLLICGGVSETTPVGRRAAPFWRLTTRGSVPRASPPAAVTMAVSWSCSLLGLLLLLLGLSSARCLSSLACFCRASWSRLRLQRVALRLELVGLRLQRVALPLQRRGLRLEARLLPVELVGLGLQLRPPAAASRRPAPGALRAWAASCSACFFERGRLLAHRRLAVADARPAGARAARSRVRVALGVAAIRCRRILLADLEARPAALAERRISAASASAFRLSAACSASSFRFWASSLRPCSACFCG